jgi:quinol monooxygenase YgiN
VKEPRCREFNIAVSSKDANHLALFEVWDNAAALDAHRATDHFKNFMATTKDMVAKRDLRAMSSVAMSGKSPDQSGLLINEVDLDIVPAQFDAFMAAAKINGAATPHDLGAHEFNIVLSQKEPHHVLFGLRQRRGARSTSADRAFQDVSGDDQGHGRQSQGQSVHFGRDESQGDVTVAGDAAAPGPERRTSERMLIAATDELGVRSGKGQWWLPGE